MYAHDPSVPGSYVGEIKECSVKVLLTGKGFDENEPIDIDAMFWGDNLRVVTAPHRWTGTAWEPVKG